MPSRRCTRVAYKLKFASKQDLGRDYVVMPLETLQEGRCVQTLHLGSFDDEADTLEQMHREFIPRSGFTMTGKHHEIYLSDFRKTDPARLRTILRQPVTARTSP